MSESPLLLWPPPVERHYAESAPSVVERRVAPSKVQSRVAPSAMERRVALSAVHRMVAHRKWKAGWPISSGEEGGPITSA